MMMTGACTGRVAEERKGLGEPNGNHPSQDTGCQACLRWKACIVVGSRKEVKAVLWSTLELGPSSSHDRYGSL